MNDKSTKRKLLNYPTKVHKRHIRIFMDAHSISNEIDTFLSCSKHNSGVLTYEKHLCFGYLMREILNLSNLCDF